MSSILSILSKQDFLTWQPTHMYLLLLPSLSFVLPTEIRCQSFPLWELLREFPSLSNGIASQMDCILYRAKVYGLFPSPSALLQDLNLDSSTSPHVALPARQWWQEGYYR